MEHRLRSVKRIAQHNEERFCTAVFVNNTLWAQIVHAISPVHQYDVPHVALDC